MSLSEKINQDLKEAMKSGASEKVGLLRMLNSALKNRQIEKGKDAVLSDEDVLQVLAKEAKKRKEANEAFAVGGRPELAEKEKEELILIESYLPAQMSREEIVSAIDKILLQIEDKSNFGIVMKEVMKGLKGRADAKIISEIIKEKIN
ncbi:MAG: hypothetical protein Athens071426_685 [Parcubacteria group bacterium Athens0714_26]|nr:MAG: hypothetical protein Athens101426_446 [Parcubacteria group bacterium Athens1014_26]TSD01340.1 MAG: hypothetical protein Athens071426_685 [Parcubacteria group bacterium Athens0714_26]